MGPDVLKQVLIPVVAILAGVVMVFMPVVVVWLALRHRAQQTERVFGIVKSLAERGLPVPPELIERAMPPGWSDARRLAGGRRPASPLFRAMTLVGLGAGSAAMFWLIDQAWLSGIGALFAGVGVAQLAALAIERRWPSAPEAESRW